MCAGALCWPVLTPNPFTEMAVVNHEAEAVRTNWARIIGTLTAGGSATIVVFAGNLLTRRLVTQAVHDAAIEATALQGSNKLMTAICDKVKHSPETFNILLTVFRDSELSGLADILEDYILKKRSKFEDKYYYRVLKTSTLPPNYPFLASSSFHACAMFDTENFTWGGFFRGSMLLLSSVGHWIGSCLKKPRIVLGVKI